MKKTLTRITPLRERDGDPEVGELSRSVDLADRYAARYNS